MDTITMPALLVGAIILACSYAYVAVLMYFADGL